MIPDSRVDGKRFPFDSCAISSITPINTNGMRVQLFVAEPGWAGGDIDFERDVELDSDGHLLGDPFGVRVGFGGGQLEHQFIVNL